MEGKVTTNVPAARGRANTPGVYLHCSELSASQQKHPPEIRPILQTGPVWKSKGFQ